jgi:hypothetical protein
MTREEFQKLPIQIALGLVYDMAAQRLGETPMPELPRSPKYDARLAKRGGFVWVSELALEDLEWWAKKKRESAVSGSEYAEKDAKVADTLERWLPWRRLFPNEQWRGTRGDDRVTAATPSKEPRLNSWDNSKSNGGRRAPASEPPPPEDDFGF